MKGYVEVDFGILDDGRAFMRTTRYEFDEEGKKRRARVCVEFSEGRRKEHEHTDKGR